LSAMRVWLGIVGLLALVTSESRALELPPHVVIKVTPTLVYIDAGSDQGACLGEAFVILSDEENGSRTHVADVRVIRLHPAFSIAEILFVAAGEQVRVPQPAMPLAEWELEAEYAQMAGLAGGRSTDRDRRRRSILVLGGGEWDRDADDLEWSAGNLMGVSRSHGVGFGLRLGSALARRWRLNMTYRVGLRSDVTVLGVEGDLHYVPRGCDRLGLYVGAGAGLQYLMWDVPAQERNSTNKLGANLMAGLQIPGALDLMVEAGYQRVLQWDDLIDMSHVRTYVGVGRAF
jgi:opacity protein-like surface antigen